MDPYDKLIYYFICFPNEELTLNEIVDKISLSKTSANKYINKAVKDGFLIKKVVGKSWQISSNQKHMYFKSKGVPYFLEKILNSGIVHNISKKYLSSKSIILFGSYFKGDSNEKSDLDIAVEVGGKNVLSIEEFGNIDLGFRKKVMVSVHLYTRDKIDINLFSNIANGIVLDGFLEVNK